MDAIETSSWKLLKCFSNMDNLTKACGSKKQKAQSEPSLESSKTCESEPLPSYSSGPDKYILNIRQFFAGLTLFSS